MRNVGCSMVARPNVSIRHPYGMGDIEQLWQNYKGLFVLGGIAVVGWYIWKKRNPSANPHATLDQAQLVLDNIDEFAEEHSRGEVARVLGNVKSKFPVLADDVEEVQSRLL
jgi:hypothetical protein